MNADHHILSLQLFDVPAEDVPDECVSSISGCFSGFSIVTQAE